MSPPRKKRKTRPGKVDLSLSTTRVLLRFHKMRHGSRAGMLRAAVMVAALMVGAWGLCGSAGLAKDKKPVTKSVSGVVLNESDTGIAGATVELVDAQSGKILDIYSQEDGGYQFTDLSFSHDYTVKATSKGRSSEVRHVSSVDLRPRLVLNLTIPASKQ